MYYYDIIGKQRKGRNPLNYSNQICPHCGKPLLEGEDIVVCPVCATPQHRECWMQAGHCANDALHASGYVWQKEETANNKEEYSVPAGDAKICHICGSENPADSLHCGNCGALFGEENSNAPKNCSFCGTQNDDDARHCKNCGAPLQGTASFFGNNPYLQKSDIAPDELIGEHTADDLALFVQASAHRYLPKFKRFASGKKLSFNFAAFFFAPYWFFYRKLYKIGIFFMIMFVTSSMLLSGFSNQILEAAEEYSNAVYALDLENATEEQIADAEEDIIRLGNEMLNKIKKPALVMAAATVLLRLICALIADISYYKKIVADMKIINDSVRENNLRKVMITRRGGLSPLAFAASLLGENMLVSVLVYAADFIMNSF